MDLVQATDQKYLVYESQFNPETVDEERPLLHSDNRMWFWTDQFILAENEHDEEFLNFRVYNLLMNDSHSIRFNKFHKNSRLVEIFLFNKNIGVIVERLGALQNIISLVRVDWSSGEFQVIEQFERNCRTVSIVMQELNPLKFVLGCNDDNEDLNTYQICKFEQGKIKFGEINQLSMAVGHFFDNKIFQRVIDDDDDEDAFRLSFKIYNLVTKKEEIFVVDDFLDEIMHGHFDTGDWLYDRFYSHVCFPNSVNSGIAWTDSRTHILTAIDFQTNIPIDKLQFFNGHLLALSRDLEFYEDDVLKVHSIPMQRPQLLRKSAWLNIIAKLKRDNIDDPYTEAIKYLPFNADIRSPWVEDTEKEANTAQGDGDKLIGSNEQKNEPSKLDEDKLQNMDQELIEEVLPKRFKVDESHQ